MRLYIQQKVFSLRDTYYIYDVYQQPVFEVQGQIFSFGAKLHLYNMQGEELFFIKQRLLAFLPSYEIYQGNFLCADIKKEMTFFKPQLTVTSGYGDFTLQGDFMDMRFDIVRDGVLMGSICKQWLSWGDTYELDVVDGQDIAFFCTLVIAIDNCLHNGQNKG